MLVQATNILPKLLAMGATLPSTPAELDYRLSVLAGNLERIQSLNQEYEQYAKKEGLQYDPTHPMFGATPLALFTQAEFESSHNGLSQPEQGLESAPAIAPETIEYTGQEGGLTDRRPFSTVIRDQGHCGGCWAFATILTLEKLALDTIGTQYDFSMQYLIDCDDENNGCDGGWPTIAYNFIIEKGVPLYSTYPYEEKKMVCKPQNKVFRFGKKLRPLEFEFNLPLVNKLNSLGVYLGLAIFGGYELQLMSNSPDPWKSLSCKNTGNPKRVSHAVTIVNSTEQYVTIQNSWTRTWGDRGFKKIIPCDPTEELFGIPSRVFTPVS